MTYCCKLLVTVWENSLALSFSIRKYKTVCFLRCTFFSKCLAFESFSNCHVKHIRYRGCGKMLLFNAFFLGQSHG